MSKSTITAEIVADNDRWTYYSDDDDATIQTSDSANVVVPATSPTPLETDEVSDETTVVIPAPSTLSVTNEDFDEPTADTEPSSSVAQASLSLMQIFPRVKASLSPMQISPRVEASLSPMRISPIPNLPAQISYTCVV